MTLCTVLQLRRTHFHDFMLDVHARLQKHRTDSDALHMVRQHCSCCGLNHIKSCLDSNVSNHCAQPLRPEVAMS